jgi:hypothetical protein
VKVPESVLNRLLTRSLREQGDFADVQSEVPIGPGMRADILVWQHDGRIALFELKARQLQQRDIDQVLGYTRCLESQGFVVGPHLVGDGWSHKLHRPEEVVFFDWSYFWRAFA